MVLPPKTFSSPSPRLAWSSKVMNSIDQGISQRQLHQKFIWPKTSKCQHPRGPQCQTWRSKLHYAEIDPQSGFAHSAQNSSRNAHLDFSIRPWRNPWVDIEKLKWKKIKDEVLDGYRIRDMFKVHTKRTNAVKRTNEKELGLVVCISCLSVSRFITHQKSQS